MVGCACFTDETIIAKDLFKSISECHSGFEDMELTYKESYLGVKI